MSPPPTPHSSSWRRSIHAELVGAFATPASRVLLAASVVMAVISGAANIAALDDLTSEVAPRLALHSATVPCLVFSLIAGAYSASADRRSGVIDQRLLTDPSRTRWLVSKGALSAIIGVLYGMVGAVTAIVVAASAFAIRGGSFDVVSGTVARSLGGVIAACALFALAGAAIGTMTSNTPAVLAGLLTWVLVVEPPTLVGLPQLGRHLPAAGALALTLSPDPELLSPALGGLSLLACVCVLVALSLRRLRHADV
jgi:hypothetical protein